MDNLILHGDPRSGNCYKILLTAALLGLPLVDVNVCDAGPQSSPGVARGWIAVGDDARGVLVAIGGKALGFLAVGGRTHRRADRRGEVRSLVRAHRVQHRMEARLREARRDPRELNRRA